MSLFIEKKDNIGYVEDVDTTGMRITGYLSEFGTKDHDGDIIEKGAFTKSINERKDSIYFLNFHDWNQPHGFFEELSEDSKGLRFVSKPLVKGVTYSENTIKLYAAGVLKEHSIGFNTKKSYFDKSRDARILKELFLWEGSNVTLGANSNTPFTGFKNRIKTMEDVDKEYKIFLKAYREGTFTDETFPLLEMAIKDLMQLSHKIGKESLEKSIDEPLKGTQKKDNEPIILNTIDNFLNTLN